MIINLFILINIIINLFYSYTRVSEINLLLKEM